MRQCEHCRKPTKNRLVCSQSCAGKINIHKAEKGRTPETEANRLSAVKAGTTTPAFRKKVSAASYRMHRHMSRNTKKAWQQKSRDAALRQWATMSATDRGHMKKGLTKGPAAALARRGPSSIEAIVATVLETLGVTYIREFQVGPYFADFLVPSEALVIECDGAYWHQDEAADQKKDNFLEKEGYRVVRLLEADIHADPEQALLSSAPELCPRPIRA